ncbi:MAG: hypothetical protein E7233_01545 [Lachnospiraceae bacterium]|nr:hypothetical protein [Lachnospiraceae bacterium]
MIRTSEEISRKTDELDELAMAYETAVIDFAAGDYLNDFYDFYKLKKRDSKLVPSPDGFEAELAVTCSANRYKPVYEKVLELFGAPKRTMIFEDEKPVVDELENGGRGLGPFFFIFYVMFCEYDDFTLCFISGTNN